MIGNKDLRSKAARLKSSVSIAAVIGETHPLQRAGHPMTPRGPVQGERTPSFYVYPDHYHCFGCGAHGDVYTWLMQAHRMAFAEAVAHLGGDQRMLLSAVAPVALIGTLNSTANVELARRIWCDA